MKGFFVFLLFLAPLIVGFFITGNWLAAFGIWIGCLVLFGVGNMLYRKTPAYKKKQDERESEQKELDSLGVFDDKTGIYTLYKHSPLLTNIIHITESKDFNIKYEPEKIHIGAATVGGVTTGGAYTTGGYNYIDQTKKNGLCSMVYGENQILIRKIKLSDADFEKAKKSMIKYYLNLDSHMIDVVVDVKLSQEEGQKMLENYKTQGYVGNEFAHSGYPTLEKGHKIMDWLIKEY